jgi:hypothetical protein
LPLFSTLSLSLTPSNSHLHVVVTTQHSHPFCHHPHIHHPLKHLYPICHHPPKSLTPSTCASILPSFPMSSSSPFNNKLHLFCHLPPTLQHSHPTFAIIPMSSSLPFNNICIHFALFPTLQHSHPLFSHHSHVIILTLQQQIASVWPLSPCHRPHHTFANGWWMRSVGEWC